MPAAPVGLREARGDEPGALRSVIERDNPVIDPNGEIRRLELVETGPWKLLETMAEVVPEEAGGPSLKRRQSLQRVRLISFEALRQFIKRVALLLRLLAAIRKFPPSAPAEPFEWIGCDEGMLAKMIIDRRAIQENGVG